MECHGIILNGLKELLPGVPLPSQGHDGEKISHKDDCNEKKSSNAKYQPAGIDKFRSKANAAINRYLEGINSIPQDPGGEDREQRREQCQHYGEDSDTWVAPEGGELVGGCGLVLGHCII